MKQKLRSCTYKKYLDKKTAYIAAKKTWNDRQLAAYKCRFCSGWHLYTIKPKRMERLFDIIEKQLSQTC